MISGFEGFEGVKSCRGSGTSLVSLIVRAGTPVADLGRRVKDEVAQARNIKDKTNRHNVLDALTSIDCYLRDAPSDLTSHLQTSGIAIFAGWCL